ncbi:hypothetical protein [Phaeodactylibacter luteus]|uniref:Uncharacterized protein n=1 Tax=Phaeodactylibacter luteus TaxID=1564516 RepID=A0A5C6S1L5_9BACT|nr:hypothetical protein [Phaeodactylibacter luteus]TXB68317.1 hypothetical protein FRY97_02755 [Phaeodactylibacter luteus]
MARRKLSEELKKAISLLPAKEKDKLLFRLVPKDESLVARLEFELLEGTGTADERREALREELEMALKRAVETFYSPGYLLLDLRAFSGAINRHVKATKDKYGEVALNLLLLNYPLRHLKDELSGFSPGRAQTFNKYVVKRAAKILKLLERQHEDVLLDFEEGLHELGAHIRQSPQLMRMAKAEGLDVGGLG